MSEINTFVLNGMSDAIKRRDAKIDQLQRALAERDAEIARLRRQLGAADSTIQQHAWAEGIR